MIVASYLSLLVFGLLDNFRGPFFSQQLRDFGLSEGPGAALFGLTSTFASLGSAFSHWALVRLGISGLMNFSSLLMGLGFAAMAAAPNAFSVLSGTAIFGLGLGFAALAQNIAVVEFAPVALRSRLMAGLHAMYGLASMIAPFLAHAFLEAGWSWRSSFAFVAWLPLGLAVLGFVALPRSKTLGPDSGRGTATSRVSWAERRHMILLGLAMATYLLAEISIGTRLVRWLEVSRQIPAAEGALVLTQFFAALFGARLLAWRWAPVDLRPLRWMLLAGVVVGAVFMRAALVGSTIWIPLAGLCLGPFYPLAMSYLRLRFGDATASAMSLVLAMGSATVVVMHFGIGWVAEGWSLQTAMQVGPLGLVVTAVLLGFEARVKSRVQGEPRPVDQYA